MDHCDQFAGWLAEPSTGHAQWSLINDTTGEAVQTRFGCTDLEFADLPSGDYRSEVVSTSDVTGTYVFEFD